MANLDNALQQLREERKQAQLRVEKLYQAISVIESLNGSGSSRKAARPTRIVSAVSRRRMAQAQRARWARARVERRNQSTQSQQQVERGSRRRSGRGGRGSERRRMRRRPQGGTSWMKAATSSIASSRCLAHRTDLIGITARAEIA
jgi:hypothetical protein